METSTPAPMKPGDVYRVKRFLDTEHHVVYSLTELPFQFGKEFEKGYIFNNEEFMILETIEANGMLAVKVIVLNKESPTVGWFWTAQNPPLIWAKKNK